MKKEELEIIIKSFEVKTEKENAVFGIYQYGNGTDESFIKANKKGLQLFAIELLKAAKESDVLSTNEAINRLPLDYQQEWVNIQSDTFIHYIEIVDGNEKSNQNEQYRLSFKDKLIPVFFIIAGLIVLFFLIIGIYAACKWFF